MPWTIYTHLTNLISFYKVTQLIDQRKQVYLIFLGFSKVFDTVSHTTFLDKITRTQLEKCTIILVNSWLTGQTQRVLVNGVTSGW